MVDWLRSEIGRRVYHLGFRMMPARYRRGIACMTSLGLAWATVNEAELLRVMSGEIAIEWKWEVKETPNS